MNHVQITEQIHATVQKLPQLFQVEALDFIEYLLLKSERNAMRQAVVMQDELDWSIFSLDSAMRGMENEETPAYTKKNLARWITQS